MPKSKRHDQIIFEEPLIDISMQPTEEVDPLFIDPTAESLNNDVEDDVLNGFSIFSPKIHSIKLKDKKSSLTEIDSFKIKAEKQDEEAIKVKEEPKDPDETFEEDLKENEIDPVEALAQALNEVEFLCPKCTYRSIDKEQVTQHLLSSHRVCQIGIPRPCDKCDFIGKTVRELTTHKKISHPRSSIIDNLPTLPSGEFKCPHCDFTSLHKNNVRSHTRVHTKDTVYTCDKCPYTAISRINIENHAARHLLKSRKKWKFQCKHCGLLERTEKLLQRHLILHGEGEMLKCQLCSYKSPYSHIISMHTRICHGIIGKKSWDREEKWKRRVRQSTRACTREKKSYTEEKNDDIENDTFKEEFLELPVRPKIKSGRGRKKKIVCDSTTFKEEVKESNVQESLTEEISKDNATEKVEQIDTPRRPTLEERLSRAQELINKNLPTKKRKNSPTEELEVKSDSVMGKIQSESCESGDPGVDGENPSASDENISEDDGSDNHSNLDEEETGSKDEAWSEEESAFDHETTADESMQSFASEKVPNNSNFKENEDSITDSESVKRDNSGEKQIKEIHHDNTSTMKKRIFESLDKSEDEQSSSDNESCRSKRLKLENRDSNLKKDEIENSNCNDKCANDNIEESNVEDDLKEASRAVLVLKRNGSSFTCISKGSSSDSS